MKLIYTYSLIFLAAVLAQYFFPETTRSRFRKSYFTAIKYKFSGKKIKLLISIPVNKNE